jgi:hypothetical protein
MPLQLTEYISGEYVTLPVVPAVVAGCPDNSVMSQALRDSPFVCAPFLALIQRPFCPFPSFRRTGCVRWVATLGAWMRMRSGRPIGTCWLGMRLPWRGTSVLADAELLGAGRWARAHALAVLAAEEGGKASAVITLSFMPPEARARIPVRELLEDHRMKMAGAVLMRI